jgi:peptide/nickel transport system substrate-binding protein
MRPFISFAVAGLVAFAAAPAQIHPAMAQKAKDTIRIAVNDSFAILDTYHFSLDEAAAFDRGVYLPLISYDQAKKQWVNLMTKSFRRIDPLTIEFDLREDITFHNGNKFDAADVKGTLEYLADPNVKIKFKSRYDWVKNVEILGPYKVRLHAKRAFSTDLGMLAYRMRMRDIETLNALADKAEYGKNPNGVGPYRVISIDRNAGLALEAVPNHWEGGHYFPQPVKKVRALFIPDRQTQVAQLMTGNIDLMRNITRDDAKNLAANPNLAVTPTGSEMLLYVTLDAAGRSKNKAMTDVRVRKAFIMAIDRKSLMTHILPGGDIAYMNKAICFPTTIACAPTTDVYAYDPAEAKKLLAEAGFPNGLDLVLHAHEPVKYVAEAIAGEVRKVGIRASVESMPSAAYVRMRGDGEFTAFTGFFPAGTHPDTAVLNDFFFNDSRDYWQDPMIHQAMADGDKEFDDAKRTALYTPILDKVNREAYILPVSELPIVWAHHKDVVIKPNPLTSSLPNLGDYGWKK